MLPTHNTIPYEARPVVTYGVMVLCLAAFGYQLTLSNAAELRFLLENALVPARYTDGAFAAKEGLARGDLLPFVTSMFLHGGLLHIAGNLWTLWVFGPALEDRLGTMRYAGLYIGAGLAAGLAHFVFNWTSTVPALGASGAIAGVIGAYVRRFPYAWINVLQPIGLFPFFFYMPALAALPGGRISADFWSAGLWRCVLRQTRTPSKNSGRCARRRSGRGVRWAGGQIGGGAVKNKQHV